jgi:hypothetical protein
VGFRKAASPAGSTEGGESLKTDKMAGALEMIKIRVSSCMCGFCHTVTGRVKGGRIIVKIDTPCEKFRELTCLEFPLRELPENQSELTLELERQTDCSFECTRECALDCTRGCLIPNAVLNAVSIGKNLAKKEACRNRNCGSGNCRIRACRIRTCRSRIYRNGTCKNTFS